MDARIGVRYVSLHIAARAAALESAGDRKTPVQRDSLVSVRRGNAAHPIEIGTSALGWVLEKTCAGSSGRPSVQLTERVAGYEPFEANSSGIATCALARRWMRYRRTASD